MSVNQNVQLNPGSGGSKVRTLELTVLQLDGSTATVEMQVLSIADKAGNVLDFGNMEGLLAQILDKLEDIRLENELRG